VTLSLRIATADDLPAMQAIMALAINRLQDAFLTPEQVKASHAVMGLDSQLVSDGSYFIVTNDRGVVVGCGGWSRRATLYGGDHSSDLREPRLLDPAHEPARIRAMYTHPDYARQGVGRMILAASEAAAKKAGFASAELMATLSGRPLYRSAGYVPIETTSATVGAIDVPLVRMGKTLG
jgi:GNAT superfamily N-acetyltransferase